MSEYLSQFMPPEHLAYNWMVVVYFFAGGLSAGAYLVSVAVEYWLTDFKPFSRIAAWLAPLILLPGLLLLMLDLGMMTRFVYLGLYFNPTSPASWGSILLGLFLGISAINAFAHWKGGIWKAWAGRMAYLGVPCAFWVAAYTGILLYRAPGYVLWHNAMLPVLFLTGGLISGLAATMLIALGHERKDLLIRLGRVAAVLVAFKLMLVLAEIFMLSGGGTHDVATARALLTGEFSGIFWGAQIIGGSLVPGLILGFGKGGSVLRGIAVLLLLVGVYAMRHIVVIGGQTIG